MRDRNMRPNSLNTLFASTESLTGVGPRTVRVLKNLAGDRIIDLLWHFPTGIIDRRNCPKISQAEPGTIATIKVTVEKHYKSVNQRQPYRVLCSDNTGEIFIIFFRSRGKWIEQNLPQGQEVIISGKVESYGKSLQMIHPDHIVQIQEMGNIAIIEATYPLRAGITQKTLRKIIGKALISIPDLKEWQDITLLKNNEWPSWSEAIKRMHHPKDNKDLEATSPSWMRLAYDELLANQLAISLVRSDTSKDPGRSLVGTGHLKYELLKNLEFTLTKDQKGAIQEIEYDMESEKRMIRLLQWDVGSGKTIVALFAILKAIESGKQAALMAPTEILARQHFNNIESLTSLLQIKGGLITGRDNLKLRKESLLKLANGEIQFIVGTHALFQKDVLFHDLALVVIDEQHRFGVHQRLSLSNKGFMPDIMVMTATPIPRTLLLTNYGDMDVSKLREKPGNRKSIETRTISAERMEEVISAIRRATKNGAKVYWVCPLIEESLEFNLAAAEKRYEELKNIFGELVGLIHGKMKTSEKDFAIESFRSGKIQILVSTTVIEVGIHIPDATVMVIEHANRFGLSQLHQLRGRIGRGVADGTCLLLYSSPISSNARKRLQIMRETNDGFLIAEEDLKLRGSGEILGTRQSGLPTLKIADPYLHSDLIETAFKEARIIIEQKGLSAKTQRGKALRTLLYLFEREAAVRYLSSG